MNDLLEQEFNSKIFNTEIYDISSISDSPLFLAPREKAVVVKFSTETCMPCKILARMIRDIEDKYKNDIQFYSVNAEESLYLVNYFNIVSVPFVLMIAKSGRLLTYTGVKDRASFDALLNSLIN